MPGSLTLRTVAHQAPLSLGFSRQEHRSGLQCSPLGDLPNPGTESCLLRLLDWQTDSLPLAPPEKPANHLPCSKASPAVPLRNSCAFCFPRLVAFLHRGSVSLPSTRRGPPAQARRSPSAITAAAEGLEEGGPCQREKGAQSPACGTISLRRAESWG